MDEQRLQEIEARNGVGEEYLRGIGYTDSADILALIAEVRRLQANDADAVRKLRNLTASFEACDDCGANACDDAKPDGPHILCHDCVGKYRALVAERDAALAERDGLRELLNVYNIGGWTDALAPMQRALKAEAALTEARRVLREVEWVSQHGKITGPSIPEWAWCPCCGKTRQDDHTPADCALAAVLAQEEPS